MEAEKALFATSNYISHAPKDRVMNEKPIVDREMSSGKESIIFIALSVLLLIGISLLPKSVPVLIPASTATVTASVSAP